MEQNERADVAVWLDEVDCKDVTYAYKEQAYESQWHFKIGPVTPCRQSSVHHRCEEFSPTDSTFSEPSIFDRPFDRFKELQSPCSQRQADSKRSNIADADTEGDEEHFQHHKGARIAHTGLATSISGGQVSDADPSNNLEPTCRHLPSPRMITLVSCLQCTIASLPCSRTLPSCTRCIRNGPSRICLPRRRLLHEEAFSFLTVKCTQPILIRFLSESDDVWNRRLKIADELFAKWGERRDRENWVMPRVDTERRCGWRVGGKSAVEKELGEGLGRLRFEELNIVGPIKMNGLE